MKKIIAILLAGVMACSMAACSSGSGASSSSSAPAADAGAADSEVGEMTLRLSTHLSEAHGCVKMANEFKRVLEETSGGKMKVEIYTDGQLGGQTENCESLIAGSVDMTIVDTGTLANYEPKIGILDMPYVFVSHEQAIAAASGEIGQQLMDNVTNTVGIRPVSIQAIDFRNTLLKDKSVNTPADFTGVKIRIPDNPSIEQCFTALGATPVAIPAGEAYTSVQTGVVDGLEGNFEYMSQMKFYEVAKKCSLTEHVMTFTAMCISNNVYDKMSDKQKELFDGAVDAAMDYFYPLAQEIIETGKKEMTDGGVEFFEVDKQSMIDACTPALLAWIEKNGMTDMYEAINALSK